MTMILSVAGPTVLQVSDRRVTRIDRNGKSIHSPVENKSVAFLLRDAVGILGYTGDAYIGTKTTDTWLAELVAGATFERQFAIRQGMRPIEPLNSIMWRIRQAFPQALGRKGRITVSMAGYRARRDYTVPFMVELHWPRSVGPDEFHMRPSRRPFWPYISQIGDGLPADDLRVAMDRGAANAPQAPDVGAFVQAIRTRARQSDLVGADLMGIRIPSPTSRRVEWKFMPASAHNATGPNGELITDISYSPWIVTPGSIYAPSLAAGGHFTIRFGEWEFVCLNDDPVPQNSTVFSVSSQRRVPRPGASRSSETTADQVPNS